MNCIRNLSLLLASSARALRRGIMLVCLGVPLGLSAAEPPWWTTGVKNANPTDDFAAINQGQLKNLARRAYDELKAKSPASTWSTSEGIALQGLVGGWYDDAELTTVKTSGSIDPYLAINQGQLKQVAHFYYDVLRTMSYSSNLGLPPQNWVSGDYPWSAATATADAYALANIGQAKYLFSFDLDFDSDGDGLPDWWELKYGFNRFSPGEAGGNPDHDTKNNLQEYQSRTNPNVTNDSDNDGVPDDQDGDPGNSSIHQFAITIDYPPNNTAVP